MDRFLSHRTVLPVCSVLRETGFLVRVVSTTGAGAKTTGRVLLEFSGNGKEDTEYRIQNDSPDRGQGS